jgi:hypothetical protein
MEDLFYADSCYMYNHFISLLYFLPFERKWVSAKSSIALGLFVSLFGLNQLFLFHSTVTYIIATLFILIGGLSIWNGWKSYRYFLPLAIEEAEQK